MLYWRKDFFENLKTTAAIASHESADWSDYVAFCTQSEKGLRRSALESLEKFIIRMEREPLAKRKHFVGWLMKTVYLQGRNYIMTPHPLKVRVIEPTLWEWAEVEPLNPEPLRWMGGVENLERAVALDPTDQIALTKLVIELLSQLDYATHELPYGYLGSAPEDFQKLQRIEALLTRLTDEDTRKALAAAAAEERDAIEGYLRKRRE